MNWTMGRYINELDTEGRDRLIAAPDFLGGAEWWDGSCGCLVGTALGTDDHPAIRTMQEAYIAAGFPRGWHSLPAYIRFPHALIRFGKDRVVRAIKLRAARLNGCSPEQIAEMLANHVAA